MFNAPGRWSIYLSYAQPEVQHEAAALATALGQSRVWLDVFLEDISLPATEEGMRCSDAFVALLSKAKRPVVGAVHLPDHALDVPNVEQLLASAKAETIIERIRTSFTMVRAPSTTAMM